MTATPPSPPIRHGYAQLADVRLHYAACGDGGRLVLLLHGFPECWYSWRHQLTALGDGYTLVAPDLRGYNLSDKPGRIEDYRLERLVGDVVGLVRYFGADDAAIAGHDWGAIIAWAVAENYPEQVWKLAALQVPPLPIWWRNLTAGQMLRSWYVLFLQIPRLPEWLLRAGDLALLTRMYRRTSVRPGSFTAADLAVYQQAFRPPGALTGPVHYYRALLRGGRGDGQTKKEKRIRVPTLFLYAERDFAILPRTVRGVGDYVDAPYREVRLPDCGHWVQNEAPAEVNAALRRFLDDV